MDFPGLTPTCTGRAARRPRAGNATCETPGRTCSLRQAVLYDGVIFDWFGTLTLTMSRAKVEQVADDLADTLRMPHSSRVGKA